jgi:putative multiple sugar transport system permease protein
MTAQATGSASKTVGVRARSNLREYGLMIALVVIMVLFQFLTDGTLFKPQTHQPGSPEQLYRHYGAWYAVGDCGGHIDLSVGSVAVYQTLCGFDGAVAVNFLVATVLCLLAGAAIGAAQGYWIAYFKIPSFIVTLAGMLVFRGLTLALLAGMSIGPFPKQFQLLSSGFIPDFFGAGGFHVTSLLIGVLVTAAMFYTSLRTRLNRQKHGFQGGPLWIFILEHALISGLFLYLIYLLASYRIPNVLIVMGILIAFFTFVTMRTTIGRRITRRNKKAAKLSRVHTERLTFITFITMKCWRRWAG